MTQIDISEFFVRRDKAWQDHDAETLTAGHTEEGEIKSPLYGNIKGRTAIQKCYYDWFNSFPDTEFHSEYLLIDGNRAAQFIKMTGTQQRDFCGFPSTGKRMKISGASLCIFTDGKISCEIRTYDFTGVLLQLGVLKAKPAF